MNSKVARHMEICKALNALYERKNHDYGDSFHVTFLEEGAPKAPFRLPTMRLRIGLLSFSSARRKYCSPMALSSEVIFKISSS